jgi:hypothetical protein
MLLRKNDSENMAEQHQLKVALRLRLRGHGAQHTRWIDREW